MKSVKELTENLEAKKQEARDFVKGLEGETLTDEQRASIDSLTDEVEALKGDLERAKRLEEITKVEAKKAANAAGAAPSTSEERELQKMADNFTFGEAVRAAYGVAKDEGYVKEIRQMGEEEARRIGKSTNGISIPSSIYTRMPEKRANVTENTTTGIVNTDFVQSVYARTVLGRAGATFISAVQDTRVPIIGKVSTQWEGEVDSSADSGSSTTKVDLTPIRLSGYVNYSKQAALQANYSLEGALRNAFEMAIAEKFDYACFTDDSSNGAFNYLGNGKTPVTGTHDTAWKLAKAVYEEVLGNNHNVEIGAFVASSTLWGEFQEAVKATGVSAVVGDDGRILTHPLLFSTQVADIESNKASLYFGDFSRVMAAQFGPIDLMVDPYSVATSGMDRLVLNSFWDMALVQDAAISVAGFTAS